MADAIEQEITREELEFFRVRSAQLKMVFERRRIKFYPCESIEDAQKKLIGLVSAFAEDGARKTIAFSDSVSLHQIDAYELVSNTFH